MVKLFPEGIMHRHVLFTVQIALSFSVGLYSMIEASKGDKAEVFLPVLTGIVGYWLPAPRPSNFAMVDMDKFYKEQRKAEETLSNLSTVFVTTHTELSDKITETLSDKQAALEKKLAETVAENERLGSMYEQFQDREWDAHDDVELGFAGRLKKR